MSKLRHIAVIVEDPEASAKFFEEAFDMKRAGTARRGIYMSDGIFNVALLKKEGDEEARPLSLRHVGRRSRRRREEGGGCRRQVSRRDARPRRSPSMRRNTSRPTGLVFDLTHTGWAGAVKDVVPVKETAAAK